MSQDYSEKWTYTCVRLSPSRESRSGSVTHLTATRVNAFSRTIDVSTVLAIRPAIRFAIRRLGADDFVTGKRAVRVKVRYPRGEASNGCSQFCLVCLQDFPVNELPSNFSNLHFIVENPRRERFHFAQRENSVSSSMGTVRACET